MTAEEHAKQYFVGFDFNGKESTPIERMIYFRMLDAMQSYSSAVNAELLKDKQLLYEEYKSVDKELLKENQELKEQYQNSIVNANEALTELQDKCNESSATITMLNKQNEELKTEMFFLRKRVG